MNPETTSQSASRCQIDGRRGKPSSYEGVQFTIILSHDPNWKGICNALWEETIGGKAKASCRGPIKLLEFTACLKAWLSPQVDVTGYVTWHKDSRMLQCTNTVINSNPQLGLKAMMSRRTVRDYLMNRCFDWTGGEKMKERRRWRGRPVNTDQFPKPLAQQFCACTPNFAACGVCLDQWHLQFVTIYWIVKYSVWVSVKQ